MFLKLLCKRFSQSDVIFVNCVAAGHSAGFYSLWHIVAGLPLFTPTLSASGDRSTGMRPIYQGVSGNLRRQMLGRPDPCLSIWSNGEKTLLTAA
jgi:hypothetical protein